MVVRNFCQELLAGALTRSYWHMCSCIDFWIGIIGVIFFVKSSCVVAQNQGYKKNNT